jgi:SAM-dependent methyltransferase
MNEEWVPPPWHDRAGLTPMADFTHHSSLMACRAHLPTDLGATSLLMVHSGWGVDTRYFQIEGATNIVVTDISERALALVRDRCPGVKAVLADTQHLPFADGAFDWAGVRSGLHHLAEPIDGLREMNRVTGDGFFFIEGQRTPLVPLLVRMGALEDREEAGNEVYRFTRAQVAKELAECGVKSHAIETAWFMQIPLLVNISRSIPGRLPALLLRAFVRTFNLFLGRWGNAIVTVARK